MCDWAGFVRSCIYLLLQCKVQPDVGEQLDTDIAEETLGVGEVDAHSPGWDVLDSTLCGAHVQTEERERGRERERLS